MIGLAQGIANFTSGLGIDSMPDDVVELARNCLLNAYGIALCGLETPYAKVAGRAAVRMDGLQPDGATLLATGQKTSVSGACLANSALFHGRAQEDTCGAAHFGTVLVPLLTALSEANDCQAAALMPALVAGYEAGGLIEKALACETTPAGFRSTAVYGTIAAAAGAARLFELDPDTTARALSNAASFTGGVLQSFADGSDEWRYQPGISARNGWAAAELARAGSSSAPHAFEGRNGLFAAFGQSSANVKELAAKLGRDWSLRRVTFKPHPVCAFNQTPVTATLAIRSKVVPERIERIVARMHPLEAGYAGMGSKGPFDTIAGTLMSAPFCIATTILYGAPSMGRMSVFDDGRVNSLMRLVEIVADETMPPLCTTLEIVMGSGEILIHRQRMVECDYQFSRDDLLSMLDRIAGEQGVPAGLVTRIDGFCRKLPAGSISEVVAIFAEASRQSVGLAGEPRV